MAPMVANGDRHCRQWMSPLAPMAIVIAIGATHQIAIGDNGASIGAIYCRHWRQWRQMIHSPNLMTLLPLIGTVDNRVGSYFELLICGLECKWTLKCFDTYTFALVADLAGTCITLCTLKFAKFRSN